MSVLHPTLRPLAERCVESADRHGRTPVVAAECGLVLAPAFYATLAKELYVIAGRPLRLEILAEMPRLATMWRRRMALRQARQMTAALPQALQDAVAVETRTVLSRPAGPRRPLVVGIGSVEDPIPQWAATLRVMRHPIATDDFQLIPAAA